jgi:hypothetical protein
MNGEEPFVFEFRHFLFLKGSPCPASAAVPFFLIFRGGNAKLNGRQGGAGRARPRARAELILRVSLKVSSDFF